MELRCDNIQYSIEGSRILNGISLGVSNNEFHTILGPNGCGKTTFLKTVYRIAKPDFGTIYLDGKPLDNISIRKSAQNMAVVAQFNNLNFDCSVLDVVMLGRTPHLKMMEQEKKEDYKIAYNALKSVGMYEKRNRSYLSLSGGEKQRVVLARAITQQPTLLLLDEPTNHLDIKYQLELMDLVKNRGKTVIAVIHDLNIAAMYCDRLYALKDGKVINAGTPAEVLTPEFIREVYEVEAEIVTDKKGQKRILYYSGK